MTEPAAEPTPRAIPAARGGGDSPVIPLLLVATGGYLAWFAVHYWRDKTTIWPSTPVKDILQGKGLPAPDRSTPVSQEITGSAGSGGGGGGGGGGSASGSAIAQDALKYKGHAYRYGGAPGKDGKNPWDCSSFCNWVIGHDMGLAIPGATSYDGTGHGPATGSWLTWSGCKTIAAKDIQAGDVMVWQTHMGIATSGKQMISAEDPADGTRVTSIHGGGPPGEVLVPRRLRAVIQAGRGGGGGSAKANQNTARLLTQPYGWSSSQDQNQWQALVELWTRESGWKADAKNPTSGAYGIPQSLPGNKMAKFGKAWKTSAKIQILWGLWYIHDRYGSPVKALAHEDSAGWY